MTNTGDIPRLPTGVRNLDAVFGGGVPQGSITVIGGAPGAGKTILTQQLCFHNASATRRVLYFSTLSEPTAKTLRYLRPFEYFDQARLDESIFFVDLGQVLRTQGLDETSTLIMEQVRRVKPAIVVIDSFKVFNDFARSGEQLRKFGYGLAVQLMAWETTTFLLGEYGEADFDGSPLFSIVDGLLIMSQRMTSGEQQRYLQLVKMRGTGHSLDEHTFHITARGVEVFAPRVTIQRLSGKDEIPTRRLKTGVSKLDDLLGEGIPRGSSLLVSGVAGTGKTVLLLEFLYRGALAGEKGLMFSFEETSERLRAAARGLGWELDRELERGLVEIVFIPQPEIMIEKHLLMIQERIEALGAQRVAIDSASVFLHKVRDPEVVREKLFQLASLIQNNKAVGFFATDIPYGTRQLSRFGVEETVVDGIILLSSTQEGFERERYVEVYKLRNTAHLKGRHNLTIGQGGIAIYPRYEARQSVVEQPSSIETSHRFASGVPGLDPLMGGGLLERSVTLVSGSPGIGKSTVGLQFLLEGAKHGQRGLFVSLEEGPAQLTATAGALGLPLQEALDDGTVEVIYLSRQAVRANQFLTILGDRIRANDVRRLVLDSVSQFMAQGLANDDLRQLLSGLVTRFKASGVTSLLTLEASSLFATDTVTDHGFSPIADNLLLLRYEAVSGQLAPVLTIIKTRGSDHDWRTHAFGIGKGGARVGKLKPAAKKPAARKPTGGRRR